ncbi:MAG TPA: histidine kinase dimerization/phospho-acceptor domain-containing protein [Emcibacteraceae bacterium]|nr:histidine kinase dimerization/phospho-acceptor domain-containing protein [Emcibacteraceae bacterium]
MVQKKAQFDDRIRNLLALAEDNSEESRTLLFSHICDLFLQERPMESENQVRMLIEIINELISDVDITIRKELANILLTIDNPPEELIKLISEDVVEVSGTLLEEAMIEEEQLLYLIKYASDEHRDHIGKRFGLSPILRRELDKMRKKAVHIEPEQQSTAESKKISLQELEEAQQNSTVLNEDATANILEVLRSKKNTKSEIAEPDLSPQKGDEIEIEDENVQNIQSGEHLSDTESKNQPISLTSILAKKDAAQKPEQDREIHVEKFLPEQEYLEEDLEPVSLSEPEADTDLSEKAEDDEVLVLDHEAPQTAPTSISDEWFWEIDRYGNIKYLSENAESVFLQTPDAMNGEDFLCLWRRKGAAEGDPNDFIALFEKRQPFRDEEFLFEISPNVFQCFRLSAIATFDIDNGRFTGFRGSAHLDDSTFEQISDKSSTEDQDTEDDIIPDEPLILETPLEETNHGDNIKHLPQFSGNLTNAASYDQDNDAIYGSKKSKSGVLDKKEKDEVASELLHNLSHEFRTPLNAIIGFSQMIDNEMWGPVSDQYRKNTKDIINAANHLKEAVNNILDSAKLEAGLIEPSPESFSLKSVIQEAMSAIAPILESKEIDVTGIDDNIDVILYNDKHCIILCLIKIITFATRHADIGDKLHMSVLVNSNAQVRIEIPLVNQNINEENAAELFQKTYNLHRNEDGKISNNAGFETKIAAGFGLSVAQDIAKLIGGELSTMSHNGKISHIVMTISTYPI